MRASFKRLNHSPLEGESQKPSRSLSLSKGRRRLMRWGDREELKTERIAAKAADIVVTDDSLTVDFVDGRSISVPLAWFPRLVHGTPKERDNWRIIGNGEGFHWPDLDEDLGVEGLLLGRPSGESQRSFQRWLVERAKRLERS